MKAVRMLVLKTSFDATGTLIQEGHVGTFDADRLDGTEDHLEKIGTDFSPAVIEMAPIGPTGPNPTGPSQIPPDAVQSAGGMYATPGKVLVGEVTRTEDERFEPISTPAEEDKVDAKLADLMGDNAAREVRAAPVEGTVAAVTAQLGGMTNAQLATLRSEEVAGAARKGVLSAIDAEAASRKA